MGKFQVEIHGQICFSHDCYHCCMETEMVLTKTDIHRIALASGKIPSSFVTRNEHGQKVLRNRESVVNGISGEYCIFLNSKGMCKVYHNRPRGCSFYPVIWNLADHKAILDTYCPFNSEFKEFIDKIRKELETFILKAYGTL